jgi:hypothetical protein
MKVLENLILTNLVDYPEWSEYHEVILNFILQHKEKRPDMSIEGCKSLIEGISKFIYFNLGNDSQNLSRWNHLKLKEKFECCITSLDINGYEKEFLNENSAAVFKLGQIRNERGDVSHGQAYPKDSYSDLDFATFISMWTEGLCYFLLSNYIISKKKMKMKEDTDIYSVKQYKEFDEYLDSLNSDIEYISYSKALKEQDNLQYQLLMDEYFS